MKREAERQLVKDDSDDYLEESEANPGQGFKKADESVLATRQIRGLPRRSLASTPISTPVTNGASDSGDISTPKFGAFTGFGSPLSSSQSFTFTPPPASPSSTSIPQASQSFTFGVPPSSTSSPASAFSSSPSAVPAVALSASSATKTFASFLGSSTQPSDKSTSEPLSFFSKPTSDPADEANAADTAAVKYYTALRGINIAFLSALSRAVEDDPFVDVAELLEQYKTLRISIQKDFDSATKPQPPKPGAATMPTPPASFVFGSNPTPTTQTVSSLGSGFVPKVDATAKPTGFTFSSAAPPVSTSTTTAAATTKTSESEPTSKSVLGSSTADSVPPFGTASGSKPTVAPPLFGSNSTSNPFGAPKSDANKGFSFGTLPAKSDSSSSVTTSLFGHPQAGSTSLFGTPGSSTVADKFTTSSSSSNPFGSPTKTTSKFGGFGGFGKPAGTGGSIGNPVGFGFGSPPKTPDIGSSGSTGFSFSQKAEGKLEKASEEGEGSQEGTSASGDGEGGEASIDPYAMIAGKNPHDEEGEGEENEDTVHAIKLKAYRLTKKDAKDGGGSAWSELGYGILRVKKHKESGTRRLLLRNSSTGKININFNIYAGLKPSLSKRTVMFVGHDQGTSQTYNVRLQTEEQARELKDVLDREIEFVKAKSES